MWRIVPAFCAAFLLLAWAALLLSNVESERTVTARTLGFEGETWRIVAIGAEESRAAQLAADLVDLSERLDLSIVHSSGDDRVMTLYDPAERFVNPGGALYPRLANAGSTPAALVSTAVSSGNLPVFVPEGIELLGTFDPEVQLDGAYPVLVQNLAAGPPRAGMYLFAGVDHIHLDAVTGFFTDNGMQIRDFDARPRLTIKDLIATPYGVVVSLFALISVLGALLTTHIHARLSRPYLAVAALSGASTRDLRHIVLRRLAPLVGAGSLTGLLIWLGLLVVLRDTLLINLATRLAVGGVTLLACLGVWTAIVGWTAWREGRICGRALPR